MELILISASKLKIMLTDSDMKKYDLSAETVDYDTTATRRAFWSILDDAKDETGFNAASDRVLIQMYPSRDGGCEMFVTKINGSGTENKAPPVTESEKRRRGRERTQEKTVVYSFDSLATLMAVCRRLFRTHWRGCSRAYREQMGRCYLFLSDKSMDDLALRYAFLGEYGVLEHTQTMSLYIKEHALPLCEKHAVETLGNL